MNVVLMVLWLTFALAHLTSWLQTGRPTGLALVALETLIAVLFVVRRKAIEVSASPWAWIVTAGANLTVLALRPTEGAGLAPDAISVGIQLVGLAAAVISAGVLGRSFGLVAANRGIRTGGPYGLVRHPLYAAYAIVWVGYLLESPSPRNFAVVALALVFQIFRIRAEEQTLRNDAGYRAYAERVRFRLMPGVF